MHNLLYKISIAVVIIVMLLLFSYFLNTGNEREDNLIKNGNIEVKAREDGLITKENRTASIKFDILEEKYNTAFKKSHVTIKENKIFLSPIEDSFFRENRKSYLKVQSDILRKEMESSKNNEAGERYTGITEADIRRIEKEEIVIF